MVKWLKVLMVAPGKAPEVRELPNNLKAIELTVGGHIEFIPAEHQGCVIIASPSNASEQTANNASIPGPFIIARADPPELISLSDEDIRVLQKMYS